MSTSLTLFVQNTVSLVNIKMENGRSSSRRPIHHTHSPITDIQGGHPIPSTGSGSDHPGVALLISERLWGLMIFSVNDPFSTDDVLLFPAGLKPFRPRNQPSGSALEDG